MIGRENVMSNVRMAGLVRRYHTWPVIRDQTVAEHSWHVARIFNRLWPEFTTKDTLLYIMYHDVAELRTGDLPYPVKIRHPELRPILDKIEAISLVHLDLTLPSISDDEKKRIKICDMLEMWEFCLEEMSKGNRYMQILAADCSDHAQTVARELDDWFMINQYMTDMQRKLCG